MHSFFGLLPCSCSMLHCTSTRTEEHFILLDGLPNEQATCGWRYWRVRLVVAVNSLVSQYGRWAKPLLSASWPAGKMTCFLGMQSQPESVAAQEGLLLTTICFHPILSWKTDRWTRIAEALRPKWACILRDYYQYQLANLVFFLYLLILGYLIGTLRYLEKHRYCVTDAAWHQWLGVLRSTYSQKPIFPFRLWLNMISPSAVILKDADSLDAENGGKTLRGQFVREHFRFRLQLRTHATRFENLYHTCIIILTGRRGCTCYRRSDPLFSSCYELMCLVPVLCFGGEAVSQKYPYFQRHCSKTCIGYLRENLIHDSIVFMLNLKTRSTSRLIMPYGARPGPHIKCNSSRSTLWRFAR